MDQINIFRAIENSELAYPILFIPKKCTTLDIGFDLSENVFIDLNITSLDTDGNEIRIYSGFCNVKVVDSNFNLNQNSVSLRENDGAATPFDSNDIDQMPITLSEPNQLSFPPYSQSQVWIDPSRSPYVYNNYDDSTQERYSFHESRVSITVKQHNTYITQNIYNYKDSNIFNYREHQPTPNDEYEHKNMHQVPETATNQQGSGTNHYEEDKLECGGFLSQLPEEIMNEEMSPVREQCYNYKDSNIFNYREHQPTPNDESEHKNMHQVPETATNQQGSGTNLYEDDELECGGFLSQLPEEIMNEEMSPVREQCKQQSDNALKQLMETNTQSTGKERKTILFLGHDSHSGQTIQKISYNNPKIKCAELEVDNELVIEHSSSAKPNKKKYQCDKCKQIFNQISAFRQHTISSHKNHSVQPQNISFMCLDCGRNLKSQRTFDRHCLGHGDPDLECDKCHKVFATKFTLRAHQKIHERKYPCNYCVRSYSTTKKLNNHQEKVHLMSEFDNNNHTSKVPAGTYFGDSYLGDISDEDIDNDITTEDAELKSEEFEEMQVNDVEGNRIRMADSVISKVISNKVFLLNSKMAKKHGRYCKRCDVCYKSFDRIGELKRHLIEHIIKSTLAKCPVSESGALNIVCEICQAETFNKVDKYKAHLREHAKVTIYKCTLCDKSFSDSSNFSKHKKTHGVDYLQCDLCQRKFNSKKMIARHMEYHNKNEPIKCRFCLKMFHFESTLKKHIKCMHNKESGTRFRCKFCDNIFITLKDKWDHEWMVHNVRKMVVDCLICGLKFRKYSQLKRHCHDAHEMGIPTAKKILKKKSLYK